MEIRFRANIRDFDWGTNVKSRNGFRVRKVGNSVSFKLWVHKLFMELRFEK